jgi:aconitate hydratase
MLPFIIDEGDLPFKRLDYIFLPEIREAVEKRNKQIKAFAVSGGAMKEFTLKMGDLTDDERQIILDGCLINFNRVK